MPRSIKELEGYLKKKIKEVTDKEFLETVVQEARNIIYKRIKSGKGLTSDLRFGANETPFKKLSKEYVEKRKTKNLGPLTKANKSNLTLSGELLESMVYKILGDSVILSIDAKIHEEAGVPTNQLAQWVSEQGRPFFGLSVKEEKILTSFIQRLIRARVKNGR